MSGFEKFPSFESVFARSDVAKVPLYLTLLQPSGDAGLAVSDIRACIRRSGPNLTSELNELLAQPNWRPHLVAAVTLLVTGADQRHLEILWTAIKRPSWVSPQLAACASRVDSNFAQSARTMIEQRCAFEAQTLVDITGLERHHALGPLSWSAHSAKLLSALVALCALSHESTWLEPLVNAEDIRQMMASDVDGGGTIAVRWISRIMPFIDAAPSNT